MPENNDCGTFVHGPHLSPVVHCGNEPDVFLGQPIQPTAIFNTLHREQDRSIRMSLAFALVSSDKGRVLLASFREEVRDGGSLAASVKRTLGTKVCSQVVWILREGESLEFLLLLGFAG
jgi:hypothetical protein